jgi:UDP-N-acetylglucosamine transferase subunit ALG13
VIFVSVGSMLPFERLVQAMDAWAGAHPDTKVVIQYGNGAYKPVHAQGFAMIPAAEYRRLVADAQLFVAHAGMGSIITAIQAGKPLLMLPRLQTLGEHNTDHQLATVKNVGNRPGLYSAADEVELVATIDRLLAAGAAIPAPISPHASPELIANIRGFIHGKKVA